LGFVIEMDPAPRFETFTVPPAILAVGRLPARRAASGSIVGITGLFTTGGMTGVVVLGRNVAERKSS
jgi:hypothetical protein